MISVIIPARNEQYLQRTINSVLEAATGEIEIIAVCDGYWPDPPIEDHPFVNIIHFSKARGQRHSINYAARMAKGKYIMKLDAHCAVAPGFDEVLVRDCEYDMTMIPRMYNLNVTLDKEGNPAWTPKLHKRTDYMYITSPTSDKPFRSVYYRKQPRRGKIMIDDIMTCMGPCFFMHKDRFWELGGCDETHGHWGQQGVEVACKAWLSGGRLVVNKNTWFAHWFRGGGVPEGHKPGFPYHISGKQQQNARNYSQDLWLNNKWDKQVRPFSFMIEKFNPPGWEDYKMEPDIITPEVKDMADNKFLNDYTEEIHKIYYKHMIEGKRFPSWLGTKVVKYPTDLLMYQQIIYENKPDVIIETGTYMGGSAKFFASICDMVGHGEVVSVSIPNNYDLPQHPRITYITGRSTSHDVMVLLRELVKGKTVMVSLDSDHHRVHVKREMHHYGNLVTPGQYMVVEDSIGHPKRGMKDGPMEAIDWFMERTKKFKNSEYEKNFVFTLNPKGWLRRI